MTTTEYLLALDPGNDTGWAAFRLEGLVGHLEACGVVNPEEPVGRYEPAHVVIELPQVRMQSKASPKSIIKLALKVGRYQERYGGNATRRGGKVDLFYPEDWKGTINGDVMVRRIESELTPAEAAVAAKYRGPESIRHNMVDAIGLGKWWLKQRRLDAALRAPAA